MVKTIRVRKNPQTPIQGEIHLPGSKSETNRLLIIGALCPEPFIIENPVMCDDTLVIREAFQSLGIEVQEVENKWIVTGYYAHVSASEPVYIHLKMAGTALRFLTVFCCFLPITIILTGSERLQERPIQALTGSLLWAGFDIEYIENKGRLPYKIQGNPNLKPQEIILDVSQTSQGLSALLLLSPILPPDFHIYFDETKLSSYGYVNLTLSILESCGFLWKWNDKGLIIKQKKWNSLHHIVGGDWSSASYFIGLAALYPCDITLKNLQLQSPQPDADQIVFPIDWGLNISYNPNDIRLVNTQGLSVLPIQHDFTHNPDIAQTYMFLATYASESSLFTGLDTLPKKECNRLEAMNLTLSSWGYTIHSTEHSLEIKKAENQIIPQKIKTFGDHRMAMAAVLMVKHTGEVLIENPDVVHKSFPDFWDKLISLGFEVDEI